MSAVKHGLMVGGLSLLLASCGDIKPSPGSPTPSAAPAGAPQTGPPPTVAAVLPNVVSTAGTWGTIVGTQFQPGATITIGNVAVLAVFRDSTTIQFSRSAAHGVGAVDITVTNPGGFAATLSSGYTYANPASFDANGAWVAHADGRNDFLTDMRFTIQNDALVAMSCGTPVPLTTPIPLARQNGDFTLGAADGVTMSGTLASTTTSYGRVNAPGCGNVDWWADKLVPAHF